MLAYTVFGYNKSQFTTYAALFPIYCIRIQIWFVDFYCGCVTNTLPNARQQKNKQYNYECIVNDYHYQCQNHKTC